jgi:hypothetical protein
MPPQTSLHGFVVDSIEPGSTVHTDGWQGYQRLDQKVTTARSACCEVGLRMPLNCCRVFIW